MIYLSDLRSYSFRDIRIYNRDFQTDDKASIAHKAKLQEAIDNGDRNEILEIIQDMEYIYNYDYPGQREIHRELWEMEMNRI